MMWSLPLSYLWFMWFIGISVFWKIFHFLFPFLFFTYLSTSHSVSFIRIFWFRWKCGKTSKIQTETTRVWSLSGKWTTLSAVNTCVFCILYFWVKDSSKNKTNKKKRCKSVGMATLKHSMSNKLGVGWISFGYFLCFDKEQFTFIITTFYSRCPLPILISMKWKEKAKCFAFVLFH